MTCKYCGLPTLPGWDSKPMDICNVCSDKKAQHWQEETQGSQNPKGADGSEYFTHVCKSCFSPAFENKSAFFGFATIATYCKKCDRKALIPIDTPKGKEIMKRNGYVES
ncbi:hypothetical protein [Vibrio antiquarius]|uniref:hypothetical protein n=1 Tax=Vibrio antiquarius (strain Ex25) TaxID=150340 RepID=UPI00265B2B52|nr:hypothetical protein [Vibrio antiquarius]MCR9964069.1 hypothetical protein [Vibrio antiquarius]